MLFVQYNIGHLHEKFFDNEIQEFPDETLFEPFFDNEI